VGVEREIFLYFWCFEVKFGPIEDEFLLAPFTFLRTLLISIFIVFAI
jgi:hypothetical protein